MGLTTNVYIPVKLPVTKNTTGIRGIYITITSTTMVFANDKKRFTTITVQQ